MPLNDLLEQAMERAIFSDENRVFQPHLQRGQGNVALIVGPNASGKSLFFRVLARLAQDEKAVPVTVSIRERTGAGTSDIAGMRRMFMFGDESEQSTGATSLKTVSKALKEAWMPTTPHGREGFILAPCKARPRAFFPSGAIHGSRAHVGIFLELSSGL